MGAFTKSEKSDAVVEVDGDSIKSMDNQNTMSAWKAYWVRKFRTI